MLADLGASILNLALFSVTFVLVDQFVNVINPYVLLVGDAISSLNVNGQIVFEVGVKCICGNLTLLRAVAILIDSGHVLCWKETLSFNVRSTTLDA